MAHPPCHFVLTCAILSLVGVAETTLSELAAELMTEHGYLNAMARLYQALASGELTRDQTSALIGARRCLESFNSARDTRELQRRHDELVQALTAARDALRARTGSSTSFEGDPFGESDGLQGADSEGTDPTRN